MRDLSRRRFVQGTGAAIVATGLAGCGSGGGDGGGGGGDGVPGAIDDHLDGANEYDGSIDDHTGEDEVTIEVGAGDGLAFSPTAIRIDAGTTVVWEWTGEGGQHNVASVDGSASDFKSDRYSESGENFEQSFDDAGEQLYVCEPHQAQGMKGGIDVV